MKEKLIQLIKMYETNFEIVTYDYVDYTSVEDLMLFLKELLKLINKIN